MKGHFAQFFAIRVIWNFPLFLFHIPLIKIFFYIVSFLLQPLLQQNLSFKGINKRVIVESFKVALKHLIEVFTTEGIANFQSVSSSDSIGIFSKVINEFIDLQLKNISLLPKKKIHLTLLETTTSSSLNVCCKELKKYFYQ